MRMPRVRTVSWLTLWLAVAGNGAANRSWAAEDYTNRVGVTLGGGAYKMYGGNLDHTSLGPLATVGVRWGWLRHVDLEATGSSGFSWDGTQSFRTRLSSLEFGGLWSHTPESKMSLQAFGGAGVSWWRVADFRDASSTGLFASGRLATGFKEDGNPTKLADSNYKAFGGVGAEIGVMARLSLRVAARFDYLFAQSTDNTGASDSLGSRRLPTPAERQAALLRARDNVDANDLVPSFWVGLTYFFSDRDSDQDGISNPSDACPYEAEDRDGFEDQDGCPDLDNDGDGVPDTTDKCPDEAEDADGFEDEDGCPDLDNDGDGIADATDRCPNEAEDKDGFEDEDGCPDFDNDGDAVPDSLDQCAGTPAGFPVDEVGCPKAMRIGAPRVLQGVGFRSGTATLLPQASTGVDSLAQALRAYPQAKLEIQVYSTSLPSDARNQKLAQERADAILKELLGRGVSAERLIAIGFAGSMPSVGDSMASESAADGILIRPQEELPPIEPIEVQKPKE